MRMSVVICTRNRADLIGQAVASVLANDHPDFDVTVIDQSTTDATERVLAPVAAGDPRLRYVHTTRVGLSAAYNAGIARSQGALLAFTDDDCIAPPGWLAAVEAAFARNADVDLLYGQVLIPPEMADTAGVIPALPIGESRRISRRDGFMIYGMGANFAARRRLFARVGGFDEVLGGGGPLRSSQDFDLQFRTYRAGLVTLLAPEVTVNHYGLRTDAEWPQTLVAYGVGDGGFYTKHVRCGDLLAARLLLERFVWGGLRQMAKVLLRRQHGVPYLRGMGRGMRDSFKFSIDRRRRVYLMPGHG